MPHGRIPFSATLALGLVAAPLAAQAGQQEICTTLEHRAIPVGTWATYRWSGGQSDGSTLRVAVIGREPHGDSTDSWYEATIDDPQRPAARLIVQLLVPGEHIGGRVRTVVMKTGSQPAMRMPAQVAQLMSGMPGTNLAGDIARACAGMQAVGWEQVTVPQGPFRAMHLHDAQNGMDVWLQPDLPFGLVKAVMRDGTALALAEQGSGAKSSISETPRDMPGFPATPPSR